MQECASISSHNHSAVPWPPGNPKDQKIAGRRFIHPLPPVKQAAFYGSRYAGLVVGIGVIAGIARQLQAEHFCIDESDQAPAVKASCTFAAMIGEGQANVRGEFRGDHATT